MVDSYVVLSWLCWYHAHALQLHHVILSWLNIFAFKFNRIKLNLNNWWLSHGATISSWPVQPRLPLWEGPNWVYCHASRRCLQRGKVMGVRYPGLVSRHNLLCPLLYGSMSPFGTVYFATTVAEDAFCRHGATHDLDLRGSWSEWPGECHGQ